MVLALLAAVVGFCVRPTAPIVTLGSIASAPRTALITTAVAAAFVASSLVSTTASVH